MTQREIDVENLGPIPRGKWAVEGPGVTILTGPNGSGKSITLDAVAAAARGSGRLPLRDGQRRGRVEIAGAHIRLGAQTRHSGEIELVSLEGRFDLAQLVDPGIKAAEAADRARIKALVNLLGAEVSRDRFTAEAFPDWDLVVPVDALKDVDLVDAAGKVKRAYEGAARKKEEQAKVADAEARADETAGDDLDLTAPHDAQALQAGYDRAQQAYADQLARKNAWGDLALEAKRAREIIDQSELPDLEPLQHERRKLGLDRVSAEGVVRDRAEDTESIKQQIRALQDKLAESERAEHAAGQELETAKAREAAAIAKLDAAQAAHEGVAARRKTIEDFEKATTPDPAALAAAEAAKTAAHAAIELGVQIRTALKRKADAQKKREEAKELRQAEEAYRQAAAATEDVLSDAIRIEGLALRVEAIDGAARLVTDHAARGVTPFGELSPGERWKLALDLGADQVGVNGILPIPQEAWESLDVTNRRLVHQHAQRRRVVVLTAEATQDPDQQDIRAEHYQPTY